MLSKWAEVRKVTVKTSLVTGKPAVKSAKVSRQGTKRNVAVTFTVPKSCDGTDWVLAGSSWMMEVTTGEPIMLTQRKIRQKPRWSLKM